MSDQVALASAAAVSAAGIVDIVVVPAESTAPVVGAEGNMTVVAATAVDSVTIEVEPVATEEENCQSNSAQESSSVGHFAHVPAVYQVTVSTLV